MHYSDKSDFDSFCFTHMSFNGFHPHCLKVIEDDNYVTLKMHYYLQLFGIYVCRPKSCFSCMKSYIIQFEYIKSRLKDITLDTCRQLMFKDSTTPELK